MSGFGSASKIGVDGKVSSQIGVDSASYEAPEILRTLGNTEFTYGAECDFWSLGVIAFEIITGVHPFQSSSPLSAFKKITATKVAAFFCKQISSVGRPIQPAGCNG